MRILLFTVLIFTCGCLTNRRLKAKQAGINKQIDILYKRCAELSDSERHITRPLKIPGDTIRFIDSINLITDSATGEIETAVWEQIRVLQDEYNNIENDINGRSK